MSRFPPNIQDRPPLLLLTRTVTIATPFAWSENTLEAVVRRGIFDKKTFATLITIFFCFGTIDSRQTWVPSSCGGGIYSLDFGRIGKPKASAGIVRICRLGINPVRTISRLTAIVLSTVFPRRESTTWPAVGISLCWTCYFGRYN